MKVSILICTHNPDKELIAPLLNATRNLNWPDGVSREIILIDNASRSELKNRTDIAVWSEELSEARVIREETPGLINARVCGFKESNGDVIIFFDDDNEPEPDYVKKALRVLETHPHVGIWGPGHVNVKWQPGGNPDLQKQFSGVYQEHHQSEVTYALDFISPSTMPYGTGMVLRREVADAYLEWFDSKMSTTTGRVGDSMASCEDLQICWIGMKAGWAVGRSPGLKISHIIAAEKAQWKHLARLRFGIYSSHSTALKEALPEKYTPVKPSSPRLAGYLLFQWFSWITKSGTPPLNVYLSKDLGHAVGAWKAENLPLPGWVQRLTLWMYNA
ncbi:MAG: glycosyltransferase family 2 protein [Balneolaceae bacterium]|nr:glycosyltransferase family 2 protein [Balneolaceae bacterium]MCH8549886.1 glycosyltransferase [Balneolaceae bacterium]